MNTNIRKFWCSSESLESGVAVVVGVLVEDKGI